MSIIKFKPINEINQILDDKGVPRIILKRSVSLNSPWKTEIKTKQ